MQFKPIITVSLMIAIGLGWAPIAPVEARPVTQTNVNLLANPNFELPFAQVGATAIMAPGWTPWWMPDSTGVPNYDQSSNCTHTCDHRIHSGHNAQRMFQFYGKYTAGIYQQVTVPENADLRFTIYAQGWSSQAENPENVSVGGTDMQMRIGLDPLGGTDPNNPRVQWSQPMNALDSWYQFSVYARAQGTQVTVFTYAAPHDARRKNEVYWDDAELIALSGNLQATAQAAYPTLTPEPIISINTPTPMSVALGQNVLMDGGFEGTLYIPCSRYDDVPWHQIPCEGLDLFEKLPNGRRVNTMWNTVQVPLGWKGWWLTPNNNHGASNYYQDHPANCYSDAPEGCIAWHNPEFRDTKGIVLGPSRIHSGRNALKYFTLWSVHEAGVLQTVNVPLGSTVRFSVWMHAWSSDRDPRELDPGSYLSSGQTNMHMKIGIDPYGGDNPWSANIIWSPEHDQYDTWGYYEVRAAAQSDKVTVFTHTMPEKGLKHNDVYVDDAELVVIDGNTAFSPPSTDTSSSTSSPTVPNAVVNSAPRPTALPRPDGAIVHIVQPGDTVFGLALQYDVPMDQILQLNGLTKDSFIVLGQELAIVPGKAAAGPTTAPTNEPGADVTNTPEPPITPTPAKVAASPQTQLCVRAFDDANSDGMLSAGEPLVKDTGFSILDAQGQPVATYTSDGVSEPHCFTRLKPGTYSVDIAPAAGMVATSDRRWSVALDQGMTVEVNFGNRLGAEIKTQPSELPSSDGSAMIGLMFVVIIAAGGWWMYRRRTATP